MATADRIPEVNYNLLKKLSDLTGEKISQISRYIADAGNSWLKNHLASTLAQKTGEPADEIAGILTTTDREGKETLWGPGNLQKAVNDLLQGFNQKPMELDEELYNSSRQAGVAAYLTKNNIDPEALTPDEEDYWSSREEELGTYEAPAKPKTAGDWEREAKEAEAWWKQRRGPIEDPLVKGLQKSGREVLIKLLHLKLLYGASDNVSDYPSEEAFRRKQEEIRKAEQSFGPRLSWPIKMRELADAYTEMTGEDPGVELPPLPRGEDISDQPEVDLRPGEELPPDWELEDYEESLVSRAVSKVLTEAKDTGSIERRERERLEQYASQFGKDEQSRVRNSLLRGLSALREERPGFPVDEFLSRISVTEGEFQELMDFASQYGNARGIVRDYLGKRFRHRKILNPTISVEEFLSEVKPTDDEVQKLSSGTISVGGQFPLPPEFLIWRWGMEKIQNPNADIEKFKSMISKPLNAQNQLARIIGKSAQSVTSQMKYYRRRHPDLQDPQIWLKILEDSIRPEEGTIATNRVVVPKSISSTVQTALSTSVDYIENVKDLTERLLSLKSDERYLKRLDLKDPAAAETLQGLSAHAAAIQAAIMVGHMEANRMSKEIADEMDEAIQELNDHIDGLDEGEESPYIDESGLDMPKILRKFFLPKLREVLSKHGVLSLLPSNLLNQVQEAFGGLVLRNIGPDESEERRQELSKQSGRDISADELGKTAALELRSLLERILTDTRTVENVIRRLPSELRSEIEPPEEMGPELEEAFRSPLLPLLLESEEKLPSRSVTIEKKHVKKLFKTIKDKLPEMKNPTAKELGKWMDSVPNSSGTKARDLVRLLAYLWK